MNKNRLEAFSDGVLAIILTIMVLELKVPHGDRLADLAPILPVFLSYVLSFIYVGIYWNNHHHLFHAASRVNAPVMWANAHLLFWLSLTPFVTAWAGQNHFSSIPVAFYGVVLLMSGVAYYILAQSLVALHGKDSVLAKALGSDFKGILSLVIYAVAVLVASWMPWMACLLYVAVAVMWLIPDRRIEKALDSHR